MFLSKLFRKETRIPIDTNYGIEENSLVKFKFPVPNYCFADNLASSLPRYFTNLNGNFLLITVEDDRLEICLFWSRKFMVVLLLDPMGHKLKTMSTFFMGKDDWLGCLAGVHSLNLRFVLE